MSAATAPHRATTTPNTSRAWQAVRQPFVGNACSAARWLLYALFVAEALAYQPDLRTTAAVQPISLLHAVKGIVAFTLLFAAVRVLLLTAAGRPLPITRRAAARTFFAVLTGPLLTLAVMAALQVGIATAAAQCLLLCAVAALQVVNRNDVLPLESARGVA